MLVFKKEKSSKNKERKKNQHFNAPAQASKKSNYVRSFQFKIDLTKRG